MLFQSLLGGHCTDMLKVFEAWASTTIHHENERSSKRYYDTPFISNRTHLTEGRLKTRMSYVHGAEERLEKKRQHCTHCHPMYRH